MYKIGICEDELKAGELNKSIIEDALRELSVSASVQVLCDTDSMMDNLIAVRYDLLFLDIKMPQISGIKLAEEIYKRYPDTAIIFITGYSEYAAKAFEIDAVDYILKPIEKERLKRSLVKAFRLIKQSGQEKNSDYISIVEGGGKKKLPLEKLLYLEKERNRCHFHTMMGEFVVYESITALLPRLNDEFIQINHGVVVKKSYIEQLKGGMVYLKNGTEYSVGRKFMKAVKEKLYM